MRKSWPVAILVSLGASICCIGPALAALTGLSIIGAAVAWLYPWRYAMIGLALVTLAFAWFQFWRQRRDACDCDEPRPRPWGLIAITFVALAVLAYPALEVRRTPAPTSNPIVEAEMQKITLSVDGMTCRSCAQGIDKVVSKLPGVRRVVSSYEEKRTEVKLDTSQSQVDAVIDAIRRLGYSSVIADSSKEGTP